MFMREGLIMLSVTLGVIVLGLLVGIVGPRLFRRVPRN